MSWRGSLPPNPSSGPIFPLSSPICCQFEEGRNVALMLKRGISVWCFLWGKGELNLWNEYCLQFQYGQSFQDQFCKLKPVAASEMVRGEIQVFQKLAQKNWLHWCSTHHHYLTAFLTLCSSSGKDINLREENNKVILIVDYAKSPSCRGPTWHLHSPPPIDLRQPLSLNSFLQLLLLWTRYPVSTPPKPCWTQSSWCFSNWKLPASTLPLTPCSPFCFGKIFTAWQRNCQSLHIKYSCPMGCMYTW